MACFKILFLKRLKKTKNVFSEYSAFLLRLAVLGRGTCNDNVSKQILGEMEGCTKDGHKY
jgi:hypothetical protein